MMVSFVTWVARPSERRRHVRHGAYNGDEYVVDDRVRYSNRVV